MRRALVLMKRQSLFPLLLILALGLVVSSSAEVTITELTAINLTGPEDKDEDLSSWIEVYNDSEEETNLKGWYLTNDPDDLTKWEIPNLEVPANGYTLIYVSGKDYGSLFSVEVHASFKLSIGTDYLALVQADGVTVARAYEDLPKQRSGFSYGMDANGERTYFQTETPMGANKRPISGFVSDTKFTVDRGFYDEPIQVEITTETPDAIIYYSTNGQEPSKGSLFTGPIEHIYEGPITIDKTTVLRAAAFKDGLGQSNVDTQTYIFTNDVAEQPEMVKGYTQTDEWINEWAPHMDEALKAVPTISIAINDDEHLIKRGQGQARFEGTTLNDYESKVSVEWLNGDGTEGFQTDAGVSRFGGYYTDHGKYSYRFQFRKEYGTAKLKYPVFRNFENGLAPTEEFDSLNLRSASHDMKTRGAYMSNRFVDDTMLEMGGIASHGRFVHVFINGNYNGQYHLRERWNAAMHASYFGGSEEHYDAINRNDNFQQDAKAFDGNQDYWKEVEKLAKEPSPWEALQGHVDLKDYYEFMMTWSSGNSESEMQAVGSKTLGVPFTFYMKDADGFLTKSAHRSGRGRFTGRGPGSFNTELLSEKHPDHQMFLADLVHKHFTNGGAMTPEQTIPRLQRRVDEIETSFIAESARWRKYKPDAWYKYQQDIMNGHLSSLADNMLDMFESINVYPDNIQAPQPNQQGGGIERGFTFRMSAGSLFNPETGDFLYTLDDSDPRFPGGDKSDLAIQYDREGPGIELSETVTVKARTWRSSLFSNGTWSPLMETTFYIGKKPVAGDLVISEIHYRPASPSDEEIAAGFGLRSAFEFIELYNKTDSALSLSEVALTNGVRFEFAGAEVTDLAPGKVAVVVANREAFEHRYGTGLPVAGEFAGFKLSDSGERLRLSMLDGSVLQEMQYNDKEPWPTEPDGTGPSLTLKDPTTMDGYAPAEWYASNKIGGSPGALESSDPGDLDQDGDGLTALIEEALGSSDSDASSGPANTAIRKEALEVDGDTASYWTFQTTRSATVDAFVYEMEVSSDLNIWNASDATFEQVDTPQTPSDKLTWRSRTPIQEMDGRVLFVRLRVTRQ